MLATNDCRVYHNLRGSSPHRLGRVSTCTNELLTELVTRRDFVLDRFSTWSASKFFHQLFVLSPTFCLPESALGRRV